MKKSELKNLIKECIKEVIFEEGVLSTIVTEVATGMRATTNVGVVRESPTPQVESQMRDLARVSNEAAKILDGKRSEVMNALGRSAYDGLASKFSDQGYFEGTQPLREGAQKGNPLSNQAPGDAGLDISNIPGFQNWGKVSNKIESKK